MRWLLVIFPMWVQAQVGFVSPKINSYDDGFSVSCELNTAMVVSIEPEYDFINNEFNFWGGIMLPLFSDGNIILRAAGYFSLFEEPRPKILLGIIHEKATVGIVWDKRIGLTVGCLIPYD